MKRRTSLTKEELSEARNSILTEICMMVFGNITKGNLDRCISYFTDPAARTELPNSDIVWKDGKIRFPHVNKSTGVVALYENPQALAIGESESVTKHFKDLYTDDVGIASDSNIELIYMHGPPAPLVKPHNAGRSTPFMYVFTDSSSDDQQKAATKYTGILCLSAHPKRSSGSSGDHSGWAESLAAGEIEILTNFDLYYDILSAYYNLSERCKNRDVVYFEQKWFSEYEANQVIEEYTALYNWAARDKPCTLSRAIRWEVNDIYETYGFKVPEQFEQLKWTTLDCEQGDLYIFTSKQLLRTINNQTSTARVYLQLALEPKPANWEGSEAQLELAESQRSGKYGNWVKPGKREYIRENSTEWAWRNNSPMGEPKEIKTLYGC